MIYYTSETDNSHEGITVYSMKEVGVLSEKDIELKIWNLKS